MKPPVFTGSCTALITPFSGGRVDGTRMKTLLDFQIAHGTAAVAVSGTTGESPTLSLREYEALVELCVRHTAGRMKVIAGVGGNDTAACLEKARFARNAGADAVLMSPPYYNKTSPRGLIHHFTAVADGAAIPLILYNVPSRTVISIGAEEYKALSRHPNINGVKEASGDFSLIAAVAAECAGELNLWCGSDEHTLPMMALGALGVVSVASKLVPGPVAELCRLCLAGDFAAARKLYARCSALFRLLFVETNPIPIKTALALAGMDSGEVRMPLVEMEAGNREMLRACMKHLELL